jgi:hypothetical protein
MALHSRRQQVESDGKHSVDQNQQSANESGRTPGACNERRYKCGNKDHNHRAGPELQVHRRQPDKIAEKDEYRRDEQSGLGSAAAAIPTLRSRRFLRAAENATAISAAPPTSATTIIRRTRESFRMSPRPGSIFRGLVHVNTFASTFLHVSFTVRMYVVVLQPGFMHCANLITSNGLFAAGRFA